MGGGFESKFFVLKHFCLSLPTTDEYKIIRVTYDSPYDLFVVPKTWDIDYINVKYQVLYYNGQAQVVRHYDATEIDFRKPMEFEDDEQENGQDFDMPWTMSNEEPKEDLKEVEDEDDELAKVKKELKVSQFARWGAESELRKMVFLVVHEELPEVKKELIELAKTIEKDYGWVEANEECEGAVTLVKLAVKKTQDDWDKEFKTKEVDEKTEEDEMRAKFLAGASECIKCGVPLGEKVGKWGDNPYGMCATHMKEFTKKTFGEHILEKGE